MLLIFISILAISLSYDVPVRSSYYAHNWYVIADAMSFKHANPQKIIVKDTPITIWKDNTNKYAAISDICPHRGASLSKGRIDPQTGCVVCPYHTFKFNANGRMVATPGSNYTRTNDKYKLKTDVPHFDVMTKGGWIYLRNV